MKKRTLLLIFLLPLVLVVSAQVNPKKGYVITLTGDTIHGVIDYRTDTYNCQQCSFRADDSSSFVNYMPYDIQGYRFDNDGVYYVSRTFPVEDVETRMFAEYVIQGGISLFYYKNNSISYYFFVDEKGNVAPMREPILNNVTNADVIEVKQKTMLKASQMLASSPEAVDALWNSDYERQNLTKLVRNYDEKYCSEWGDCIQFQYDEKSVRSITFKGLRVEAGMLFGTAKCNKFSYSGSSMETAYDNFHLSSPRFSIGLDFGFPRLSRGLTAQVLLGYVRGNATKKNDLKELKQGKEYLLDRTFGCNLFDGEFGFAYSFLPDSKISPVVRAGLNLDILTGFDSENIGGYEMSVLEEAGSHGNMVGFYIGAGADFALGKHALRIMMQFNGNGAISNDTGIKFLSPEIRLGFLL